MTSNKAIVKTVIDIDWKLTLYECPEGSVFYMGLLKEIPEIDRIKTP